MSKTIYLDHNATTPPHPDLGPQVLPWLNVWGNPSSIHWAGREPKRLIREARLALATLLGVDPLELIFTSGGSESNNLAIQGVMLSQAIANSGRDELILSGVEHPSVRKTAEALARRGFKLKILPVDREGQLDLQLLREALNPRTALVSIMLANNETGHIFPIPEIVRWSHAAGALVHCDAVQGLGKIPVRLVDLGVDLASFSGHKFYALKGSGVLYVRRGLQLEGLIHGGAQERGRRAGTENLLAIASLGWMAGKAGEVAERGQAVHALRDHLEQRVLAEIPDVTITGAQGLRLPNTSSLILAGIDGETLLMNLDVQGFAVSTGAACSSGSPEPSPILLAMGLSREEAQSSLRLSLGWGTHAAEVDDFVATLKAVVTRLRGFRSLPHRER